ncbi:MAG: DUF5130 family protein [Geodermatophilaceae bacterium]
MPVVPGEDEDRSGVPAGPFSPKQLARLDEALTLSSRETGVQFSLYVGVLEASPRRMAEDLHAALGATAPDSVLVAVSPGERRLEIVTGQNAAKRLPDRTCALAALSMTASFSGGDLVGGIVNGLRMLADQAGKPSLTPR